MPTGAAFLMGGGRGGGACCSNILRLAAREDLSPARTLVSMLTLNSGPFDINTQEYTQKTLHKTNLVQIPC